MANKTQFTADGKISKNIVFYENEEGVVYKVDEDFKSGGSASELPSGNTLPATAETGSVFVLLQDDGTNKKGLYRYDGTAWMLIANTGGYGELLTFTCSMVDGTTKTLKFNGTLE